MVKKVAAGFTAFALLGGLAYYSSYLYSSQNDEAEKMRFQQELKAGRQEFLPENTDIREMENQILKEIATQKETEEEKLETALDPDSVQADTEHVSYYLVEEFGYVNIYLADQESIYEYTDISIDSLPEDLQVEICTGKGIASEQELYDFLENYSS